MLLKGFEYIDNIGLVDKVQRYFFICWVLLVIFDEVMVFEVGVLYWRVNFELFVCFFEVVSGMMSLEGD